MVLRSIMSTFNLFTMDNGKIKALLYLLFLFISPYIKAQTFEPTLIGITNYQIVGHALIEADNSFYIAGTADNRIYLIKTNQFKDTIWSKVFPSTKNEYFSSITKSDDNSLIITKEVINYPIQRSQIMKINYNGEVIWDKAYKIKNYDVNGLRVVATNEQPINYIAFGYIPVDNLSDNNNYYDCVFMKLGNNGDTLVSKSFHFFKNEDYSERIVKNEEAKYLATCYDPDLKLKKVIVINNSIDTLYTREVELNSPWCLLPDYSMVHCKVLFENDSYFLKVTKTDLLNNSLWQKDFHISSDGIHVDKIIGTKDDGFLILGAYDTISTNLNSTRPFILKLSKDGNKEWLEKIEFAANNIGYSAVEKENVYVILGSTRSQVFLTQINKQGKVVYLNLSTNIINLNTNDGANVDFDISSNTSWTVKSDQDWAIVNNESGNSDSKVSINVLSNVNTLARTSLIEVKSENIRRVVTLSQSGNLTGINFIDNQFPKIYPIPAKDFINVNFVSTNYYTISLFSASGKMFFTKRTMQSKNEIDLTNLLSGIYFIEIKGHDFVRKSKIIIER